jgi:carbonic anhydrase/acetyltransferase-like protein (isoleucine patch superfamily)
MRYAGAEPRVIDSPSEMGPGPAIILPGRVHVSDKLMRDFVGSTPRASNFMLGLKRCVSVDYNLPIQDVVEEDGAVFYSCFLADDAAHFRSEKDFEALERRLIAECSRHVTGMREVHATFRMPTLGRETKIFRFPITSSIATHLVHWVTLLRLNSLQWGVRWMEHMRADPLAFASKSVRAVHESQGINPYRIMSGINVIGGNCSIHPTAWIEASFIGSNVSIGAGATIRNSIVGDGAVIGDQGYLMNSVIGPDCFVTDCTALIWVTSYPGSSIGNLKMQMALIGRDTYLGVWSSFLDAKFLGDIMVEHRGALVSSGTSFLGSCVGHNCVMGGKALIMPGRAIPNGTFMVTRPDEAIVEIPPDLPAGVPMIRHNGTLIPYSRG